VRWEYTEPYKYIIVLANNKVQIKDEEKKSEYDMASNKSFKQINDMMIQLVQGTVFNSGMYSFQFKENAQTYFIELTPIDKKLKTYFQKINLFFDKITFDVTQMKMIEVGGDYTTIKFSNKKLNQPIAADKFILK
jgi:outer membrane lipoprotein-sorting protein